jgi:hypothetical protein
MEKFDKMSGNDSRGNFCRKTNGCHPKGRYKVEDAESILYSDYGTTIYSDKIVFASARYRKFRP